MEDVKCYSCNKTGHFARDYLKEKDKLYRNKGKWKPKSLQVNIALEIVKPYPPFLRRAPYPASPRNRLEIERKAHI